MVSVCEVYEPVSVIYVVMLDDVCSSLFAIDSDCNTFPHLPSAYFQEKV